MNKIECTSERRGVEASCMLFSFLCFEMVCGGFEMIVSDSNEVGRPNSFTNRAADLPSIIVSLFWEE